MNYWEWVIIATIAWALLIEIASIWLDDSHDVPEPGSLDGEIR